ncbi:MAG: hypothetical protein HY532_01345 [Chloroflexi bacterium]|nr:hypothetical protein [Chloroflexota bacterium]
MPYRIAESPALFVRQLGIKAGHTVALGNAPPEFASDLASALPPQASLLPTGKTQTTAGIVIQWPDSMADMMQAITQRITQGPATLSAFWVVIPKKPVAEKRRSDLFFQPVLDAVLPTGLVDNKTLTFSEEEYGIRFVVRKVPSRGYAPPP